jgi:hypothetical protein
VVIVSNPTVTFRDGPTGRQQVVSLGGGAVEIGGGAAGSSASGLAPLAGFAGGAEGSHALAAAAADDTNPCDGSPRQQQAGKPR